MLVSFCGAEENGKISFLGGFGLVLVLEWFWVGGYGVWKCFANFPLATRKNVPRCSGPPLRFLLENGVSEGA